MDFWRKHVEKRHADWHDRVRSEVQLVNTYVLDPAHIAPSRSDANSNGHFPLNSHAPVGTPRGFQLNQQFPLGFPMSPGMAGGAPPGMAAMFSNGQTIPGMPGVWAPNAALAGVGPMRTNGRNFAMNGGHRMPGPYARTGRGRMPSMSGGRSLMEGGTSTIGPTEAVAGRSLRSYEDLDADKGEGTGELNY